MEWTCPHCGSLQVVTEKSSDFGRHHLNVGNFAQVPDEWKNAFLEVSSSAIRCAKKSCNNVTVRLVLGPYKMLHNGGESGTAIFAGRVFPGNVGKPFPEAVPQTMLNDYNEAWSILELSPKSSATLARRCLQAMIRDFCGI